MQVDILRRHYQVNAHWDRVEIKLIADESALSQEKVYKWLWD
jgi:hypothetical protein